MKILSAFLLTFMFILTGCGNTSSEGDVQTDASKYLRVSTASDSSNVPVAINKYVMLVFSAAIDESTVDESSVYITDENNVPISAALTVTEKTVSIIPNEFFLPNKPYSVVVTTTVEDIEGRTLENTFTLPFLTASAPDYISPSLLSVTPGDGIEALATTEILMEFDEDIAGDGVLQLKNSDTNIMVNGTTMISDHTLHFVPHNDLDQGSSYTVTLQGTVEDFSGNAYDGLTSWNFSVIDLIVVSVSYTGQVVRIEFSEHLDPSTVSESDFAIFSMNGDSVPFDMKLENESTVHLNVNPTIKTLDGTEKISVSGTIQDIYGSSHNNGVTAIYTLGEEI
ncbi:Ig-like domain-containing protein [Sulfurovum sp. CS9]|uniref:Ig-like domain-containing protein n=1 Tax=Sulfurovum sp. CS9 TaxID=3391146 RepID=UPI0039E87B7F